ncbi:MAG: hypothetical protein CFK49_09925 [Armatimonadetes bacterium JP3_11]|jgi:hypothetical protein|nr:MAG: hypothetical protein CFK48_02485 [Armatimonadetes bacterium CP1_7O]OYT74136.1 MAG: hypothetical protein CFK49_09925 [Armatimonadetes bacterium JP3_11]RMH06675.1 MAG: hypothetical protein D6697_10120 [Armatimonadota bacterium]
MGVFRLYAKIASHLVSNPQDLDQISLDAMAALYSPYAYIGNRKSLKKLVLEEARQLKSCPSLQDGQSEEELAAWWFGRKKWQTDSGAFPDFVLAYEKTGLLGDGALLELKDSRGAGVASFNSTLPSARKQLTTLAPLVTQSVQRYEECRQCEPDDDKRDCFYLIRTHKQCSKQCRVSLVHGAFFETLPNQDLLAHLWQDVLRQANAPDELLEQIIHYLAQLDRAEVAQTRQIEKASVKPRLRIMSEIHAEGNPHTYPEIPPRSVNLIFKQPEGIDENDLVEWVSVCFGEDRCEVGRFNNKFQLELNSAFKAEVKKIHHRRNGMHIIIQTVV